MEGGGGGVGGGVILDHICPTPTSTILSILAQMALYFLSMLLLPLKSYFC